MSEKIKQIEMGKANAYLIKTRKGYILVDAGIKGKSDKVRDALAKFDADLKDVILIIITHVHYDHVGSLKELKKMTGAPILAHKNAAELLEKGKTDFPKGTMLFSKIISRLANLFSEGKFEPVEAEIIMDESYNLSEFGIEGEVVYTPGHTDGSISVIIEGKHFICGDTFFNFFPNSIYPPFANDQDKLIESWMKIASFNCEKFYPGHGDVFDKSKFIKSLNEKI